MKNIKALISFVLITALFLNCGILLSFAKDYENHWAKSIIEELINGKVISGNGNGIIRPDDTITRAEFIKVINKYYGYTEKADVNFPDVNPAAWYFNDMLIARKQGYITGDNNGNANPENPITRAEVCVIMARVLELEVSKTQISFIDTSSIPKWAFSSIQALYAAGMISGYPDGSFRSSKQMTRAEAFSLIARNDINNNNDEQNFGDITNTPFVDNSTSGLAGGSGGGGGGGGGGSAPSTPTTNSPDIIKYDDITNEVYFRSVSGANYEIKLRSSIAGDADKTFTDHTGRISATGNIVKINITDYINDMDTASSEGEYKLYIDVYAKVANAVTKCNRSAEIERILPSVNPPQLSYYYEQLGDKKLIVAEWNDVADASGYQVRLLVNGEDFSNKLTVNIPLRTAAYNTSEFDIDSNVVFEVVAISGNSALKNSKPASITPVYGMEGNGSETNPYIIKTASDIEIIRINNSSSYKLANDIWLTDFTPLPDFLGSLDGNGYSIILDINKPSEDYVALFAKMSANAKVNNLTVEGKVTGKNYVGSIVGYGNNAIITNCVSKAEISGNNYVGGISGDMYGGSSVITNCRNYGKVSGNNYVGGITGESVYFGPKQSANYGEITGLSKTGGICGHSVAGISSCFNAGKINGGSGICGYMPMGYSITDCYNRGETTGHGFVNDIVRVEAYNKDGITNIINSYDAGTRSGLTSVPFADSSITIIMKNSYYVSTDEIVGAYGEYIPSSEISNPLNDNVKKLLESGGFEILEGASYPTLKNNKEIIEGIKTHIFPVSELTASTDEADITFNWKNPDCDYDNIRVVLSERANYTVLRDELLSKSTETYTCLNMERNKYYNLSVYVIDSSGNSSVKESCNVFVAPPDLTPPGEVADLVVTAEAYSALITFTPPEDSDYKSALIFLGDDFVAELDDETFSYEITGLSDYTEYDITVKTCDLKNNISSGITTNIKTKRRDVFKEWLEANSKKDCKMTLFKLDAWD